MLEFQNHMYFVGRGDWAASTCVNATSGHLSANLHVKAVSDEISISGWIKWKMVVGRDEAGRSGEACAGSPCWFAPWLSLKKVLAIHITTGEVCSNGTKLQSLKAINLLSLLSYMKPPLLFQRYSWRVRLINLHHFPWRGVNSFLLCQKWVLDSTALDSKGLSVA